MREKRNFNLHAHPQNTAYQESHSESRNSPLLQDMLYALFSLAIIAIAVGIGFAMNYACEQDKRPWDSGEFSFFGTDMTLPISAYDFERKTGAKIRYDANSPSSGNLVLADIILAEDEEIQYADGAIEYNCELPQVLYIDKRTDDIQGIEISVLSPEYLKDNQVMQRDLLNHIICPGDSRLYNDFYISDRLLSTGYMKPWTRTEPYYNEEAKTGSAIGTAEASYSAYNLEREEKPDRSARYEGDNFTLTLSGKIDLDEYRTDIISISYFASDMESDVKAISKSCEDIRQRDTL